MIEVCGLCKAFPGQTVLDQVDLHVEAGEVHGLLGRNGAGKTTLLRVLLGLLPRDAGRVRLFGLDLAGHLGQILPRVGSLIETPGFYPNLTAAENLKVFAPGRWRDPADLAETLRSVGLADTGTKTVGRFSLGMKQRLGIARALVGRPELVILDEPTNGLDPQGIHEVRTLIQNLSREQGRTVLVSSHLLSEVEQVADTVTILDSGRTLDRVDLADFRQTNGVEIVARVARSELAAITLGQRWPQAEFVVSPGQVLVRGGDSGPMPAELNRLLVEAGFEVSSLVTAGPTLESHFLRVTRESV